MAHVLDEGRAVLDPVHFRSLALLVLLIYSMFLPSCCRYYADTYYSDDDANVGDADADFSDY